MIRCDRPCAMGIGRSVEVETSARGRFPVRTTLRSWSTVGPLAVRDPPDDSSRIARGVPNLEDFKVDSISVGYAEG